MDGTSKPLPPSAESTSPHDTQQPIPQYTTVGSIYNPEGTQPLQAPTRRGRAFKWPNNNAYGDQAYAARSFLGSNVARGYGASPEHLTVAGHLPHYSPLQQNSDRAVSPATIRAGPSINNPLSPQGSWNGKPSGVMSPDVSLQCRADPEMDSGDIERNLSEQPDLDCAELRLMSVKTLTNLASYPNPMQKQAQNKLKARPSPTPFNSHGIDAQLTPTRLSSETPNTYMDNIRATLRSELSDKSFNLEANGIGADAEQTPLSEGPPSLSSAVPTSLTGYEGKKTDDKTPNMIFSNAHGAPQPLTAGPPGLRPFRSSALDDYPAATPVGPQIPPRPHTNLAPEPIIRQQFPVSRRSIRGTDERTTEGSTLSYLGSSEAPYQKNDKIVDTISEHEARRWYPHGLPSDFNFHPQSNKAYTIDDHWLRFYSLGNLPAEIQQQRSEKIQAHFYSGSYMYHKTIYEAARELETRNFRKALGFPYGHPEQPYCRIDNKHMPASEAKKIPTHEHARPLLSMLFQSFVRCSELSE